MYVFFHESSDSPFAAFSPFTESSSFQNEGLHYNSAEEYIETRRMLLLRRQCRYFLSTHSLEDGAMKKRYDQLWQKERYNILYKANVLKFTQNNELKRLLLSTDDATLVYAVSDNRIYGIGYSEENALSAIPFWGANVYGKVLMDVRAHFRKQLPA